MSRSTQHLFLEHVIEVLVASSHHLERPGYGSQWEEAEWMKLKLKVNNDAKGRPSRHHSWAHGISASSASSTSSTSSSRIAKHHSNNGTVLLAQSLSDDTLIKSQAGVQHYAVPHHHASNERSCSQDFINKCKHGRADTVTYTCL